ncbi:unnamed protein product, partial [Iphiclides podalirius]
MIIKPRPRIIDVGAVMLRNLAYPQELELLSYASLVQLLDSHFKPKQCSFVDKANFYGANRGSGESLGEWAARLRGLASYCDFGTALETNLRDRFVLGLGPGPERDKLFEQNPSTLTLTRAIELAEQAACAKQAMGMMCNSEAIPFKEEPVYRVRDQRQPGRVSGARRADGGYSASSRCAVCGMQNHQSEKCRYKSYKCQKCGKKGHLKKVCNKPKNQCLYLVNSHTESDQKEESDCGECQNFNLRIVYDVRKRADGAATGPPPHTGPPPLARGSAYISTI